MIKKRIGQHVLFWAVYYIICLYNELYLSPSFSAHPTVSLFMQCMFSVFLLFAIKVSVAYFIMYSLLPGWVEEKNTARFLISVILILLFGTLVMRLATQLIIWSFIYQETPPPMKASAVVARFFYSMLELLQVTGVAVCIKLYKLRVESVNNEKNLIAERSRAEVLHLKSQTNPHFLFNTLNSIYSLSRTRSEATPDSIMRLSKILRYTLYDSGKKTISIGEELKMIRDYIELQQLRFGKRIEMDLKASIDSEFVQITPLLLLPLVENAYKHCDEQEAVILFDLHLADHKLHLKTSNPVSEKVQSSNGTGLNNLKRQLELLYKEFSFEYVVKDGCFRLELMINLNSYAGDELFDT